MATGNRNSNLDVANFQIELMTLIPSDTHKTGYTVEKLMGELLTNPRRICRSEKEKSNLKRKIQDYLKKLSEDVHWGSKLVVENIGPTQYWKWKESAKKLIIPPLNADQCLALLMIEKRLKDELPPSTLQYLQSQFDVARETIVFKEGSRSRYSKWQSKVVNQSPTQTLRPAKYSKEVHNAVMWALFDGYQLTFSYLKPDADGSKDYKVNPLGIVMRGPITYLIASKADSTTGSADHGTKEQMFALHRIRKAAVLDGHRIQIERGTSLENFIEHGGADFTIGKLANGQIIKLELITNSSVASRLKDTPLTDDQVIKEIDGTLYRITASLPITMQLGWWLLGFGPRVEVIKPRPLRDWIVTELQSASDNYRS
jgi:predicted DNA-binding transcriptional regulator YafY